MHIITASYTSYITSMYLYVRNHCILHLPHIRCSESHTYHWQASYRHLGPEKSALLPSKQTFDKAFRLFKTLQPRFDNFLCPICCPDGDISLCPSWHIDGVAIGLQRNKAEFKPVDVGHVTDTDPVIGTWVICSWNATLSCGAGRTYYDQVLIRSRSSPKQAVQARPVEYAIDTALCCRVCDW